MEHPHHKQFKHKDCGDGKACVILGREKRLYNMMREEGRRCLGEHLRERLEAPGETGMPGPRRHTLGLLHDLRRPASSAAQARVTEGRAVHGLARAGRVGEE